MHVQEIEMYSYTVMGKTLIRILIFAAEKCVIYFLINYSRY